LRARQLQRGGQRERAQDQARNRKASSRIVPKFPSGRRQVVRPPYKARQQPDLLWHTKQCISGPKNEVPAGRPFDDRQFSSTLQSRGSEGPGDD
jgi:hypothetical protein